MTIGIGFHQSCYRKFKTYYLEKVQASVDFGISRLGQQESDLPLWTPSALLPLCAYLRSCAWWLHWRQFPGFNQPQGLP